ncbi:adenylate/guanylate cyclase domain-containing protein [Nevskia sp.]|uniref:adenylate/guanylate cyclase domain-containing protein n=1 Tax=Nevskia sp. TaxID=1929292 RepID=UPI0025F6EE14|nr:adenylate/guanylate cyclase domain-containing protein [Nevskia sp.]
MEALIPQVLVSLVALGMALAFISADRESPTSRALAATLALIGISIFLNGGNHAFVSAHPALGGWLAIPESAAIIGVLEWLLRVRRTIPAGALDTRGGDHMLRLGQLSAVLYSVFAIAAPDLRIRDFQFAAGSADSLSRSGFWLFAGPILFSGLTGLISILLLLRRQPDRPERVRVVAVAVSMPLFMSSFVLTEPAAPIALLVGEMIMLIGATQYHVLQGQRGQFMSRFLSTQVADLVRRRGMKQAMEQNFLEISVVVCDLRGFTAYAQAHPSSRVIEVLRDYYDAVGVVVAEFGGTIKDYAGDGILILVGAPLPLADHAAIGLGIAHRVREVGAEVTRRWSSAEHRLGIGVGVASGFVTVGIIGGATRLEYTAVGPAVNLASRLCEQAVDREILIDGRTQELARDAGLESRAPLIVKGYAEPVSLYALPAA